jgi:hypothetical protein
MPWAANQVVPNQTSKASPAIAGFGERLHMVHLGSSSNDLWWSMYDGTSWKKSDGSAGNERIPSQMSRQPPALAARGSELHMVHIGNTSTDLWWSVYDGSSWSTNQRISGQRSKATPALTVFGSELHMVHLGESSNDLWWSIYDGSSWKTSEGKPGNERIPGQRSKASPAIAPFALAVIMVHLGDTSDNLWASEMFGLENSWRPNVLIQQTSRTSPALALVRSFVSDDWLHMVHSQGDGGGIVHSRFGQSGAWTAPRQVPDQSTKAWPALGVFRGVLHMVHLGSTSNRIWHSWLTGVE